MFQISVKKMIKKSKTLFFSFMLWESFHASVFADRITTDYESLSINWSDLKIRQRVLATFSEGEDQRDYSVLRQKAFRHALDELSSTLKRFHVDQFQRQGVDANISLQSAQVASEQITRSSYEIQNEFFINGLNLVIESSLAKALYRGDILFSQKDGQKITNKFTGVMFKLEKPTIPQSTYVIEDEENSALFTIKDMSKKGYDANLMGRWFVNPTRDQLTPHLGANFLTIHLSVRKDGFFFIPKQVWLEAYPQVSKALLDGRIVLALPSQPHFVL